MGEHTVRKTRLKQIIIPPRDLCNSLSEIESLLLTKIHQSSSVLFADNHNLKRPRRPPRTHHNKAAILEHKPLLLLYL